jgi:hypothetical protein
MKIQSLHVVRSGDDSPFEQLVHLGQEEEGEEGDADDHPLPAQPALLEDVGVERGDVQGRNRHHGADEHARHQQLVGEEEARPAAAFLGEQAGSQVAAVVGVEEDHPRDRHLHGGARFEDGGAGVEVGRRVAPRGEVAVAECVDDEHPVGERQGADEAPVDGRVRDELLREEAAGCP